MHFHFVVDCDYLLKDVTHTQVASNKNPSINHLNFYCIKQLDYIFPCVYTIIDYRRRHWENVTSLEFGSCRTFCSLHAVTSYDTHTEKCYLFVNFRINPPYCIERQLFQTKHVGQNPGNFYWWSHVPLLLTLALSHDCVFLQIFLGWQVRMMGGRFEHWNMSYR